MQATRQEVEIRIDLAIAVENTEYCGKMGTPGEERGARELRAGSGSNPGSD